MSPSSKHYNPPNNPTPSANSVTYHTHKYDKLQDKGCKMHYKVTAKFHKKQLAEFFKKLSDGTIESQKPDGVEILNSMKRAIIKEDESLEWYETCFCATPLKHERETVYDTYLYDFKTTLVEENQELKGDLFWDYMEAQ